MKIKAAIWTLIVLMVWVLITLCFTFYPNECFWIIMGLSGCLIVLSGCLIVWAIYNIILNELKNKNE
jgi:uncharacterized BrkB/YihY/UPF0761 family membrane protein